MENARIEEDVGNFIDSLQSDYTEKIEMIKKTIITIEKEKQRYLGYSSVFDDSVEQLRALKLGRRDEQIKEICNLIIDYEENGGSEEFETRFCELKWKIDETIKKPYDGKLVVDLAGTGMSGCVSILNDYITFINKDTAK